jgi:methylase of polypeptide subunit release factors
MVIREDARILPAVVHSGPGEQPIVPSSPGLAGIIELLCPAGGVVIDPFLGSGTTAVAASNTGRRFIGSDLNPDYVEIASNRMRRTTDRG